LDKVVHFEIPADNVERAKKFYQETFDWKMTPVPQLNYTPLGTVEIDEKNMPKEAGAINGGFMERSFGIQGPALTINVTNIDAAIEKIQNRAEKLFRARWKFPQSAS